MESYKKPPLGVMPKFIWKEHRVIELADGIIRKTAEGDSTDEGVVQWALEIVELLQQIKQADNIKKETERRLSRLY